MTDSELFYNSILDLLEDPDECAEVDDLLSWWNRSVLWPLYHGWNVDRFQLYAARSSRTSLHLPALCPRIVLWPRSKPEGQLKRGFWEIKTQMRSTACLFLWINVFFGPSQRTTRVCSKFKCILTTVLLSILGSHYNTWQLLFAFWVFPGLPPPACLTFVVKISFLTLPENLCCYGSAFGDHKLHHLVYELAQLLARWILAGYSRTAHFLDICPSSQRWKSRSVRLSFWQLQSSVIIALSGTLFSATNSSR